jgi:hypothetical protein
MALTTQAYGLVKNKNLFSQGPQALLLYYFSFLKCRLHTYSKTHAYVNMETSLVECLREMEERRAKHEEV